jgi:hypothetical protein
VTDQTLGPYHSSTNSFLLIRNLRGLGNRQEFQNYVIQLVNRQTLSGTMISAMVTPNGVEVWHASDAVHLVERFVPWQAIKTYRLGHVPIQTGPDANSEQLNVALHRKRAKLTGIMAPQKVRKPPKNSRWNWSSTTWTASSRCR